MELLIAKGADIEARDGQGYTPLTMVTRMSGPFEALELLVKKGANINLPDSLGNTPLDNAIIYANADNRAIDLLLARSPTINKDARKRWRGSLSAAARRGSVRLFDYYRARGGEALLADRVPSPQRHAKRDHRRLPRDGEGAPGPRHPPGRRRRIRTARPRCTASPPIPGPLDMIELLVRNGADVNARTNNGRSAYNIAEAAGNRTWPRSCSNSAPARPPSSSRG